VVHFERLVICSLVSLLLVLLSVYWYYARESAREILLKLVTYYNSSSKQPGLPIAQKPDRNKDFWRWQFGTGTPWSRCPENATLAAD